MSQQEKAAYFRALKNAGVQFDKHYREYKTEELKTAYDALRNGMGETPPPPNLDVPPVELGLTEQAERAQAQREAQRGEESVASEPTPDKIAAGQRAAAAARERIAGRTAPVREADPNEMPGQRLNTGGPDTPIRTDEQGRVWYQEEVLKPGYAKPRGRRVLQYTNRGTVQETVQDGRFIETFEVAGTGPVQTGEIKITLPSYQTGIYKDPRFPFKVHTYNGVQGFDFFEVAEYYGGLELVPATIKRMYVENVLCFDIRTTVLTIQAEFRQMQLTGRIK